MTSSLDRIKVQIRKSEEVINIAPKIEEVVPVSGIKNGVVNVLTTHISSGLQVTGGIPCLGEEMLTHFSRLFPEDENYHHRRYPDYDGRLGFNADAHLKSVIAGISFTFPIEDGKLVRGSRQTIHFMEYDGPMERTNLVQVMGEWPRARLPLTSF